MKLSEIFRDAAGRILDAGAPSCRGKDWYACLAIHDAADSECLYAHALAYFAGLFRPANVAS